MNANNNNLFVPNNLNGYNNNNFPSSPNFGNSGVAAALFSNTNTKPIINV